MWMEGSPEYLKSVAVKFFQENIIRQPLHDMLPKGVYPMVRYTQNIMYVPDLSADPLPVNSDVALSRHMSLRKNFKKLPKATKAEFTERLTLGVEKGYWTVIKGAELHKLRRAEGGGHFLLANYVLKDPAEMLSTKARLVLDPSKVFKRTLLTQVNVKKKQDW